MNKKIVLRITIDVESPEQTVFEIEHTPNVVTQKINGAPARDFRLSGGQMTVEGIGTVPYASKLVSVDGYTLIEHGVILNKRHYVPCPLLLKDKACDDCSFAVNSGRYRFTPKCAAHVKLKEQGYENTTLLEVLRKLDEQR